MNTVHDIIKNSLCLGCGLCEALDKENCKMVINQEGFYEPIFRDQHRIDHKVITKICPGIVVHSQVTNQSIWGNVKIVANAWASDSEIRKSSSSGNICTSHFFVRNKESGRSASCWRRGGNLLVQQAICEYNKRRYTV